MPPKTSGKAAAKGTPHRRNLISVGHYPPPPNSGKLYNFFERQKRLVRVAKPSNDDIRCE